MAAPLFAVVAPAVVTVVLPAAPPAAADVPSAVSDVNPDSVTSGTLFGGRVEAFAVNPVNPEIVFAATEDGGLWKSVDHGNSWVHVDAVPLTQMSDVKFAPTDANLVIATGSYDGSTDNRGGGIWMSTDGGTTWAKAPGSNLCTPMSANSDFKISIDPVGTPGSITIFVGTNCGLAVSTNSGATWSLDEPSGTAQILDVEARPVSGQLQVDVCGNNFFDESQDGGVTWPIQDTGLVNDTSGGSIYFSAPDFCSIATAPNDPNTVFFTSLSHSPADSPLLENDDASGGGTWHNLNVSSDSNGRPSWVMTLPGFDGVSTDFEVFYGTNSIVMHQTCSTTTTPRCSDGTDAATDGTSFGSGGSSSGAWTVYDASVRSVHWGTDPATLAIDPDTGCPFLEGGDPGVFQTSNGCAFGSPPTFTSANNGEHALEIYQLTGTSAAGHTDVYYGMQDNGINWSNNASSVTPSWASDLDGDVNSVLADPTGPPSSELWASDGQYILSSETSLGLGPMLNPPPGNLTGPNVAQFGYQSYAFITSDGAMPPDYSVQVTTNGGGSWTQMGGFLPGPPNGLPPNGGEAIVASGTATNPVFYLELKVSNVPTIYRLSGPISSSATLTPADNGLTTPSVFNVNPTNPLNLYAVDAGASGGSGAAMYSTDGGASWQTDASLTSLVTDGGVYPFNNAAGGDISAIAFDGSSNTILVGTNFTGVFASTDEGADWITVPGSQQISRVTSFFFDTNNPGTSYVGSYGRGVWKLVLPSADLSITKTASPNPVTAGDQLTYTLNVSNSGPSAAGMINVVDSLPSDVTYLTSSIPCTLAAGQLTCAVPDLASGASFSFTVTVLVNSDTVVGSGGATTITNTATVMSGDSTDPNLSNNTASVSTTVVDSADLSVAKICKPDTTIYEGQPISCTVFIDNAGPSWARNVQLNDTTLSNGPFTITDVVVTPGPTTCTVSFVTGGQNLDCDVGNIANASTTATGQVTVTYTVTGTSTSSGGQNIDNTATVSSDTPDPNPDNNTATVNLTATALADLALTKNGPSSVVAGTPITWTLFANNLGFSDASNAEITDTVPAGVTITSVSMPGGSCVTGVAGDPTQPAICQFGTLPAGATSATMTVNAVVNPQTTGILQNNASVSSATFDPNLANNLASTSTTVNVVSDLSVTKTATPNTVIAGTALSYQIAVSNSGPSTATSVTLTDPLPAGETFVSTGGVGTCGFQTNTNTVSCTLPNIDPGGSDIVFIYTTVNSSAPPGPITNTATATATGSPPAKGSVTTTVNTSADLGIVLTSDATLYKPSSTIHYDITVTNAGPSDAQNVVVVQNLPTAKNGYYISNSLVGCPGPIGLVLTCSYTTVPLLVTIPPGGSVSFQVNFHITGNKGTITSSATVSSATPDPNLANNMSIRNVTVHS